VLESDHPLLDDIILFRDGERSNLMRYIREPSGQAIARQGGVTLEQAQIIQLSANAGSRLSLRNHALAD